MIKTALYAEDFGGVGRLEVMMKPFILQELAETVRRILDRQIRDDQPSGKGELAL